MRQMLRRAGRALTVAVTGMVLLNQHAVAAERDDVMKTVNQWVDSLNQGDVATAIAACAEETSIVDEFAPFQWHGKGTCAQWAAALAAFNQSIGLTDGVNKLRKPWRVDIEAERAYVVVPADFHYKLNGKPGAEIGAIFTVALRREAAGWRISGWAWSRPKGA
ncbi:nuclear transport factor 2 family protein [Nitrospirillum pindoramense]|uniref:SnoaL-like protein n=1 Tax=Nitrospirillum amazonense TaxID=28077 RepID=A0A560HD38_9PROT|nr:nuclear transport factor 2 family protein [Nitrospirillum amazonense]TWB44001.1 SnoaL-like protein [Nitrospirillum amazonense]